MHTWDKIRAVENEGVYDGRASCPNLFEKIEPVETVTIRSAETASIQDHSSSSI